MKIFGDIYQSYVDCLANMVAERKGLPGRTMTRIQSAIKNNKVLLEQYRLMSYVANSDETDRDTAKETISVMSEMISNFGKEKIKEANDKLHDLIVNELGEEYKLTSHSVNEQVSKLIESFSTKSLKRVGDRIKMSNTLAESIVNRNSSTIEETVELPFDGVVPNELILSVVTEKMRDKYGDNELIMSMVESIINDDQPSMVKIFENTKNECISTIDKIFEQCSLSVKNKLLSAKIKISGMTYNKDEFGSLMESLITLQENLIAQENEPNNA